MSTETVGEGTSARKQQLEPEVASNPPDPPRCIGKEENTVINYINKYYNKI